MAESSYNFSKVTEAKDKVSVSVGAHHNNGTMFIETRNQTSQYKSGIPMKEKSTTFEIKSVVQSSRQQEDGEESADEYDETCSDIVDGQNNSTSSPPITNEETNKPAIVDQVIQYVHLNNGIDENNSKNLEMNNQEVLNLDLSYNNSQEIYEPLNIQKTDNTQAPINNNNKPLDQWQTRFKVVKIGSAEPFRRGRWSCMDFVDPPPTQDSKQEIPSSEINLNIESNSYVENPISTNQNALEMLPSQQTSLIQENVPLSTQCSELSTTSTSTSFRPSTPQISQESQPTYSNSTNSSTGTNPSAPQLQAVSTTSSQVVEEFPPSSSDNEYSPSVLSQASMTSGYQTANTTINIPNGFAPLGQSTPNLEPASSQDVEIAEVPKDSYPSFQALLEPLTINMTVNEEGDGAGAGTGTVALDNKIEQAMDLVKSHLMFAVREEVDVLKDKISELTERIHQLEYENGVLRSHATPEVLLQLAVGTTSSPPS